MATQAPRFIQAFLPDFVARMTEKLSRPDMHDALINAISGRFYKDERLYLIDNGFNTTLICAPSDLDPAHKDLLAEKVKDAVSHVSNFGDIHELHALYKLAPQEPKPYYHAALGLYLYFEDECSRLGRDKTFLTTLREAKVAEHTGEDYNREALRERFNDALEKLGMNDAGHKAVLDEWMKDARYTLQGDVNGPNLSNGGVIGTYARLARDICMRKKYIIMNDAISYAYDNRQSVAGKSAEDVYDATSRLTRESFAEPVHPQIEYRIRQGEKNRINAIIRLVHEEIGATEGHKSHAFNRREAQDMAREVLEGLPDDALELIYRRGYSLAYVNSSDIRKNYPEKNIPTESAEANELARRSKAVREPNYRFMLFSNGSRRNPGDIEEDPQLRNMVFRQSLTHETFHLAEAYLTKEEIAALITAVDNVSKELKARGKTLPAYFNAPLKTMDHHTLAEVLDTESAMYNGYSWQNRHIEVACNLYGFMNTEFPASAETINPYHELPSVNALKNDIAAVLTKGVTRCRELYPSVLMPAAKTSSVSLW